MTGFIYSIFGFLIAIGILVVVHEFGHFWVARRLGVKVLRFSVGFGKPLWVRRAGADGTEYALSALPLGGYVKMLDETEGEVAAHERHRAFNRQHVAKRMAIVLAGPGFNFLFAILAYALLFMIGVEGLKPVVGKVADDSPAQVAGFRAGDTLLTIDGKEVRSWDQHRLYLYQKALDREQVRFEVRDPDGYVHTRELDFSEMSREDINAGQIEQGSGLYGYVPEIPPVIGVVEADSPAQKAGMQAGDRIVEVSGTATPTWQDVVTAISANPDKRLRFLVARGDAQLNLEITPKAEESNGKRIGKIGAGVQVPQVPDEWRVTVRLSPLAAVWTGVESTWSMSVLTLKVLYKMLTLEVSTDSISGPITIAQYAGYSAQIGLDRFIMFLAVISISLGVLNLLPIPVLDGGHLLYYAIEAVKGGPLPEHVLGWGQRLGVMLLLALMMLAFYNDFVRLFQ